MRDRDRHFDRHGIAPAGVIVEIIDGGVGALGELHQAVARLGLRDVLQLGKRCPQRVAAETVDQL